MPISGSNTPANASKLRRCTRYHRAYKTVKAKINTGTGQRRQLAHWTTGSGAWSPELDGKP